MSELTKNINDIFGYVLLYSVIIFTALSALFGRIVVYPIYKIIKVFNKIRETCCTTAEAEAEAEIVPVKKPIIDENWCNVSVKNIINFASEVTNEVVNLEADASEADASEADASEAEDISNAEDISEAEDISNAEDASEAEDISNAEVVNSSEAVVVEEVLSIRRPSEEELRKKEEEEEEADSEDEDASEADADADDYSPKDKYSIGHYKSKPHIKDPLDFVN
jgi:hypothetical protein